PAVVGPNGSGKSTLVRALVGRIPFLAGSITVDGDSIASSTRRTLATRIAVVTQREEPAFPLTVHEYVSLGRYPHLGMWHAATRMDRVAVAHDVELTETQSYSDRSMTVLSCGDL